MEDSVLFFDKNDYVLKISQKVEPSGFKHLTSNLQYRWITKEYFWRRDNIFIFYHKQIYIFEGFEYYLAVQVNFFWTLFLFIIK